MGQAEEALRLVDVLSHAEPHVTVLLDMMSIVETAASLFSDVGDRRVVLDAIAALGEVCKQLRLGTGEKIYAKFLRDLADICRECGSANTMIALAFSIEQATAAVIDASDFTEICSLIGESSSDLRYRNDNLVGERWTIILPAPKAPAFELHVLEKIPGVRAASAVISLLLWAKRECLVKHIGKRKWRRIGVMFVALPVQQAKTQGFEIPAYVSPATPGVLAQLADPTDEGGMPLPLFIADDFLTYADRSRNPDNKCSLWLTMLLYDGVIQNFTHFKIPKSKARKLRGELICDVFGTHLAGQKGDKASGNNDELSSIE